MIPNTVVRTLEAKLEPTTTLKERRRTRTRTITMTITITRTRRRTRTRTRILLQVVFFLFYHNEHSFHNPEQDTT